MGKSGRKPEVEHGRSVSAQVRAVPVWKKEFSRRELAKTLALFLLWRIDQEPSPDNSDSSDDSARIEGGGL